MLIPRSLGFSGWRKGLYRKRVTLLVGHFGSGKTEIALNGALELAAAGMRVTLADLDVVKPYFRSRSARAILSDAGIELLAPTGANVHADLPIIVPQIRSHLRDSLERPGLQIEVSLGVAGVHHLEDRWAPGGQLDPDVAIQLSYQRFARRDVLAPELTNEAADLGELHGGSWWRRGTEGVVEAIFPSRWPHPTRPSRHRTPPPPDPWTFSDPFPAYGETRPP